ncbi:ankyrin [Mycolicibacterium aurum]|uniref:Ankyrin n=1 Tax=Mycolicibacterium aurum TaxID=1791 RepID=A0A448ITW0_MYCAU|nr:ankyrin repeat domain-containing protein [Mycolicibacterium aurum]VEG55893.1 ankyrin [Mycolicibacterium aurum]
MASTLPDNPSLDHLRAEARTLQREVAVAAPDAVDAVRRHHPRAELALTKDRFALHDAQLVVARRYGFSGWSALAQYLRAAAALSVDPARFDERAMSGPDRFCALAVLRYTDDDAPPRWASAARMLSAEPGLADAHVWAAAAAGDPDALARHLTQCEDVNAAGGPFGWAPLLYLCYSRVDVHRTADQLLTAATLLLDAGADPNAGYLWRGMSTPFTALTGAFGEGEQGARRQPRHPHCSELAALLLRRGAHPVDQQSLYNRMFRPDNSHLELLFAHGLADAAPSPWERRLGGAMESRAQMWRRQVDWAAAHGFAERLDLLARHGVDVAGAQVRMAELPDDVNALDQDGATALHHAAWSGDIGLIRRLLDAGADPSVTDRRFDATPQGWAQYAYQTEAADLLGAVTEPRS